MFFAFTDPRFRCIEVIIAAGTASGTAWRRTSCSFSLTVLDGCTALVRLRSTRSPTYHRRGLQLADGVHSPEPVRISLPIVEHVLADGTDGRPGDAGPGYEHRQAWLQRG